MGTNCSSHSDPDTDNKCSIFALDSSDASDAIRLGGFCLNSKGRIADDTSDVETASDGKYNMRNFCTIAGAGGNNQRTKWCDKVGDSEWSYESQGSGCCYNDCNNYQDFGFGCCNACCGIVGAGVKCKRTRYKAKATNCCVRDLFWHSGYPNCSDSEINSSDNNIGSKGLDRCWLDSDREKTCNVINRDITNISCRDNMLTYCTGGDLQDPADTSWISRWIELNPDGDKGLGVNGIPPCQYALQRNLFTTSQCPKGKNDLSCSTSNSNMIDLYCMVDPSKANLCANTIQPSDFKSSSGFTWSTDLMDALFTKYRQNGLQLGTLPGFAGYNSFQNNIFSICYMVPGICEDALQNLCATDTIQDLTLNPSLVPWCGCHLPDEQYSRYTNQFQITKECTPTCNRAGVIKASDPSGTNPLTCEQNVCIIDDVTIALAQTNVGGPISFTQICGNCGSQGSGQATCDCTFSGITVGVAGSNIGGGINFSQQCGNTTCLQLNPDQEGTPFSVKVDCNDPTSFEQAIDVLNQQAEQSVFRRNVLIVIIILFIIAIILLIIYFLDVGHNYYQDTIIKRKCNEQPSTAREVELSQKAGSHSFNEIDNKQSSNFSSEPGSQSLEFSKLNPAFN